MSTESKTSSTQQADPTQAPAQGKQTISPTERWALITEHAYAHAQKRGFVGGDPYEDLLEAEKEIDAVYSTDFQGVFALTDAAEIAKQLKSVFAGFGLGQRCLDNLMNTHRDGLEKLAELNRKLADGRAGLADRQTAVLEEAASEAVLTLESFAQGWGHTHDVAQQAKQSTQAIRNALSHLRALTNSMASISRTGAGARAPARAKPAPHDAGMHDAVVKAYAGKTLSEIAEAPVAALKGVSETDAKKLEEAFGILTIRDMAANRLAEWARAIVILADSREGRATPQEPRQVQKPGKKSYKIKRLKDIADAPVDQLEGISEPQAKVLKKSFGIQAVRDLANHRLFCAARAIVMLAETEE
jgi:hypothetical protein